VDNLAAIIAEGGLASDATMISRGGPSAGIGMQNIKGRRLTLPVPCHPGDKVGEYVPFYFCPRSIMLFVIHCANHPELAYRGGQGPIVHLEADLHAVVAWAQKQPRRWAFSLSNAGAYYTEFRSDHRQLTDLDWNAIAATDFRGLGVKEGKQAEFLVYGDFPWSLVSRIGVRSVAVASQVRDAIHVATHQPKIIVEPSWYF
jgi:hypothetical protein